MLKQSLFLGKFQFVGLKNKMNAYLNKILKTNDVDYVIASDTDSIYLNMGPLVETVYKGREKTTEALFRSLIRSVRWNLKNILKVATKNWRTM
jgi:DNA-binding phage protein